MDKYLVVIDMQKDFIDGALGTKEAVAVVPRVVDRIVDALKEGRTLLFTQDTHEAAYLDTSEGRHLPVAHCIKGTDGWQLHEAIAPYAAKTIEKPSFGAPALAERLLTVAENGGANLDIALCGVCTDICVVTNALLLRAHLPEATLRIYADACAGVTPQRHEAALVVMAACQAEIETV
ncbi:MAG: cysteine hydrolase [Oscillospiraceae bacterium]|jgi:nicotinamidase-related amidase|nr:cysteine hydrolase [Oscillospiraceae bacterium]